MQYRLALVIILILLSHFLQAQGLIIRGGGTFSKTTYVDGANYTPGTYNWKVTHKVGFLVGVGLNIPLGRIYSIQPSIDFVQKGYLYHNEYVSSPYLYTTDIKRTFNYLEFPLIVKRHIIDKKNFGFFIFGGGFLSVGTGGQNNVEFIVYDRSRRNDITRHDILQGKVSFGKDPGANDDNIYYDHSVDFGLLGGVGVLLSNRIIMDARYEYSHRNLDNDSNTGKNRVIQLAVGYQLQIKKK